MKKLAWMQIILSLVIGFVIGTTFDNFNVLGGKSCHGCHKKHCGKYGHKHGNCKGKHGCKDGHCKGTHYKFGRMHGDFKDKKKHMLEKFASELDLTSEQKTKVAAVFESKHKKMMELRDELRPKFEALRKSTQDDTRVLLTPEQQKKFDEIHSRWEAKHEKWRSMSEQK